jgi:2-keto-4-pentenoate hydratase/2-oxohepta-3-ene-1,7-dioic acid hydratase in catechol pathway
LKIVRFKAGGKTRYGVLSGHLILEYEGTPYGRFKKGRKKHSMKDVKLLTPVTPTKIIAVGFNYWDRAVDANTPIPAEPIIFLKPLTSLRGPEDPVVYPPISHHVDYEAELAIVIKKKAKEIPPENARDVVLGYTCLNDVSARDLQRKDGQWTRGKSFDSFCPVGPCIATDIDPNNVEIELLLNGERKQHSNTKNFIFPVEEVVAFCSQAMTLLPGDVITTGTPSGIGPMQPGDTVEVKIEGIGTLRNTIVKQ